MARSNRENKSAMMPASSQLLRGRQQQKGEMHYVTLYNIMLRRRVQEKSREWAQSPPYSRAVVEVVVFGNDYSSVNTFPVKVIVWEWKSKFECVYTLKSSICLLMRGRQKKNGAGEEGVHKDKLVSYLCAHRHFCCYYRNTYTLAGFASFC